MSSKVEASEQNKPIFFQITHMFVSPNQLLGVDTLFMYFYHSYVFFLFLSPIPSLSEWIQQPQNTAVRLGDDFTVPCLAAWVNDGTSGSLGVVQSQSSSSSSLSFSPSSNAPAVDSVGSGSSAPSQPTALKYTWALNPGPITEKATKLPDHSLFIPRASESDLGSYTCTVSAHFEGSEDDIVELVAPALVVLACK